MKKALCYLVLFAVVYTVNTHAIAAANSAHLWQTIAISGPQVVCTSTATYTINNPPGSTVNWSSSNTSVMTINSSTGAATRVATGTTTISASLSCGGIYTLDVTVLNTPKISVPQIGGPCEDPIYSFTTDYVAGASYLWTISNPHLGLSYSGQTAQVWDLSASYGGNGFTLVVQITLGSCAVSNSKIGSYILKTPAQCGGGAR